MTEIKPNLETKWDILYDPSKKSLFSKLEEFAINNYFSNAFAKFILSITKIEKGKIFEPGSGGGMTCANFAQLGFEIISMDLSNNALRKGISLFNNYL
jgi:2-polyprenyl-3-methyl-5-hydroxy-6-metoxy-1,4-benzoquinol methylase